MTTPIGSGPVIIHLPPVPTDEDQEKRAIVLLEEEGDRPPVADRWIQRKRPTLEAPVLDIGSLIAQILVRNSETSDAQTANLGVVAELRRNTRSEIARKVQDQMDQAIQAQKDADAQAAEQAGAAKWEMGLGIAGLALSIGIGVAAIFVTGGAAAPMVFVAVMGAALSLQQIAATAITSNSVTYTDLEGEQKALDISLPGLVGMYVDTYLHQGDYTVYSTQTSDGKYLDMRGNVIQSYRKDGLIKATDVNEIKMALSIAVTVMMAIGMMILGGKGVSMVGQVTKSVETGSKLAANAERVASALSIATDISHDGLTIHINELQIKINALQRDSTDRWAEKKFLDAVVNNLTHELAIIMDLLQKSQANYNDDMAAWLTKLQSMYRIQVQTARNLTA